VVPDELLESAAAVLQEGRYIPTGPDIDYAEALGPNAGSYPFPKYICIRHLDIPEDDPYMLEPPPSVAYSSSPTVLLRYQLPYKESLSFFRPPSPFCQQEYSRS
jgi:hypothetical protein